MSNFRLGSGALGALMLTMSVPSLAADAGVQTNAQQKNQEPVGPSVDDVPAPPMFLLFGIAAAGVTWGRRLAANARKKTGSVNSE
ncbi:hypothetical protein [Sphingobium nicotianae]|uniref:PEP-CTERM sorting domain-containing protein n=1 Tax=Sphingobium nicotianae TaxID=2782607 RepID=A0A9X1DCG7_9SPHN|nr:hypothetical protein [Sphingobium nicotianae]MBT2187592.1 hypothetical protein [Sphingobium nicotianae]